MRRTLSCLLVLLLLFTLVPVFAAGTVTVTIDGVPVSYDQSSGVPFIDENGRTLSGWHRVERDGRGRLCRFDEDGSLLFSLG